jgi:MoxR-like ATPase
VSKLASVDGSASRPTTADAAAEPNTALQRVRDVATEAEVARAHEVTARLVSVLRAVLLGQDALIDQVVIGLLAAGHLLLEGLPGLGKTQLVKALGHAVGADVRRIQFTPDLLPGDVTGSPILQEGRERRFVFQPGPLFGHFVLADEINRASPKTQSALLEAMQEGHVTVLGETHPLPEPFLVLATQNPIELEGTYPLPEAQLDRFLLKLEVRRTSAEVLERIVLSRDMGREPDVPRVLDRDTLLALQALCRRIHLPQVTASYIARLVDATHDPAQGLVYGASPRAALALAAASRARALLEGRIHTGYDDVRALAVPALQHRIGLGYRARLDGVTAAGVVRSLLESVPHEARPLPPALAESAR